MPKYSFGFKKKVVKAYLRGEGGYSYLAKKYVELLVLHTLLVQILIHALCAPAVVLGDNGNVHRILTFKNHIVVGCLRLQLCDLLCLYCDRFLKCLPLFALGLQCLEGCDGKVGICDKLLGRIHTVSADRRKHLGCDPTLVPLCRRKLASEDQTVKTGLVDKEDFLPAAKGVAFRYPLILVINMLADGISQIAVTENCGYILTYEIRLTVNSCCAYRAELCILKNL